MSLGERMKENYELRNQTKLIRRMPVIIRIDGKAFHTFTRGFNKPYDDILMETMIETMEYLCCNIQGCKYGYTQSDEISLLLTDYDTLNTEAWFDYKIQKICSVSASIATYMFNIAIRNNINSYYNDIPLEWFKTKLKLIETYNKVLNNERVAVFDSRCFNIPKEEVPNYFIWRQQDATRNSIEALGQSKFTQKELECKNLGTIQDMLFKYFGINWNNIPSIFKRGCSCYKKNEHWEIDRDIPIFTYENLENVFEKF